MPTEQKQFSAFDPTRIHNIQITCRYFDKQTWSCELFGDPLCSYRRCGNFIKKE